MGEITESILEGILCYQCGAFVSEVEVGHLQLCEGCDDSESDTE